MGIGDGSRPVAVRGNLSLNQCVPDLHGAIAMAYAERGDYRAARASLDAQWPGERGPWGMMADIVAGRELWDTSCRRASLIAVQSFINRFIASNPQFEPPFQARESIRISILPEYQRSLPVGNIGVVADYPLFDGGRITAQIREQEARLASAQANLRKLELQIRLDVETALLNVTSSAATAVQSTQKAIEQSKEASGSRARSMT